MLIADNLPSNLILHGLFFGKPVLASKTAAHPDGAHWNQKFGSRQSSRALRNALLKKLQIVGDYGCYLTETHMLREAVNYFLKGEQGSKAGGRLKTKQKLNSSIHIFENVVTAAQVRQAYISGVDLKVSPGAVVTPLARDLAMQYAVTLEREDVI
jgi:DNA-binding transcriptional regulator WhiA